jgi:hypothetical protein
MERELMTVSKAHVVEADREMAATEIGLGHDYPRVAPDVIHALVQQAYFRANPSQGPQLLARPGLPGRTRPFACHDGRVAA